MDNKGMNDIRVLADGLHFPKGPAFDVAGNLWCVEQEGEGLFCRYVDGSTKRIHTGGQPSALVCHEGNLWFCDPAQNAIRRLSEKTGVVETILDRRNAPLLTAPNALLFDSVNNLIITCSGPLNEGQIDYVAIYPPDGRMGVIAEGLLYPNALAFYPNQQTLLISEMSRQRIWSGYWDVEFLSWETLHVWASVTIEAPALGTISGIPTPSGMTVGPDGNLYVAIFGAGIIRSFSSEGQFIRDIRLPGQNPSDCVFDPSGELGLIITETARGELLSVLI
jgi:gluconolactonase